MTDDSAVIHTPLMQIAVTRGGMYSECVICHPTYFSLEELDTEKTDSRLMISIIEAFAQAENESRSDNIKWGNKQRAANGTSKLYDRKCYGYTNDDDGKLIIVEEEAKVAKMIFDWYLQGDSVGAIIKKLKEQGIKTFTGKDNWSKRTVDTMLILITK